MRVLSHISASEEAMQAKKVPKNSHFSSSSPPLSPSASRIGRSKEYELKSAKIKAKLSAKSLNSPSFRLKTFCKNVILYPLIWDFGVNPKDFANFCESKNLMRIQKPKNKNVIIKDDSYYLSRVFGKFL